MEMFQMICCTCSEGRANWYGKERFSREEAERDAQKHMFENEGHFATVAAVIKLSGNPAFTN
jgi:hypothetical protein